MLTRASKQPDARGPSDNPPKFSIKNGWGAKNQNYIFQKSLDQSMHNFCYNLHRKVILYIEIFGTVYDEVRN